ncbi:MAG: HDOD domain-containing protein [bacterium]|nr:HDOD domain-containing protein [bacterium]
MPQTVSKSLLDVHPRELKGIIKEIPTLPVIYQELFQKMQDANVSVPEIAEIISQDQALTSKILHLVNSAFYGYSKEIRTISRAVVILGFQAVRSAALAISVFDFFNGEDSNQIDMTQFWKHSIACGSICKVLAEEVKINQQEEAFVVGLLHDTGKLIEKRYFSDDFDELVKAAQEQEMTWFDTEKALFQIHHATIGKAIFRAWKFPSSVVDAVQFHHTPDSATKFPQLTALAHLGDYMAYPLGYPSPGALPPTGCNPAALKILGLTLEDCQRLIPKIEEDLDGAMEILKLV